MTGSVLFWSSIVFRQDIYRGGVDRVAGDQTALVIDMLVQHWFATHARMAAVGPVLFCLVGPVCSPGCSQDVVVDLQLLTHRWQ